VRIALVHYWLVGMRGGERVLEALCELYPQADVFTHVYEPSAISEKIRSHRVRTTFIQKLPFATKLYKQYLPLMPCALEQLDLHDYDLVISSESGPAKGIIVRPDAAHICYCHSPMRYIWDMYSGYLGGKGLVTKAAMRAAFHYMRIWDVTSATRVDRFIANSSYTAARIRKYWRREASVVPPPVEIQRFEASSGDEGYYLWLGQLVQYKRPDIAVRAFNASGRRLVVVGKGEELSRMRKMASGNIRFEEKADDSTVKRLLEGCRALVFPGVEDFGIAPIEAMASGKPVVAFRRGGALDLIVERKNGIFFDEQTPEALNEAIDDIEADRSWIEPEAIRSDLKKFSPEQFKRRIEEIVDETIGA
jgi:glycosyltransferase involved in cell wall biosynthesis